MKPRLIPATFVILLLAACGGPPASPVNQAPSAQFTASTVSGPAPLTVQFTAADSRDPDGTIVRYDWTFGDGTTSTGLETSHTFTAAGRFEVVLRVTDNVGAIGEAFLHVTVTAGDGQPGGPGDPGEPGEPGDPLPEAQLAGAALQVVSEKREVQYDSTALAFESVLHASQVAGSTGYVFNGTVTQTGPSSWSYSPTPADRLILQFQNGNTVEVVFTALDGDLSGDHAKFLRNPHSLHFRLSRTVSGVTEFLTFTSQRDGSRFTDALQGEVVVDDIRWTVDLRSSGTYRNVVDVEIDYESEEAVTGTVQGGGMTADVDEYWRYRYLLVDNAVENNDRQSATSWTFDGSTYRAQDVRIRRSFTNGVPAESEYWIATGTVLKDGAPVATIGHEVSELAIDIFLDWGGQRYLIHRDVLP